MKILLPFALSSLLAVPAMAQDVQTPPDPVATPPAGPDANTDSLTIGVGLAYLPDYEGSGDYRFVPGPGAIGTYHGFSFQLVGNRLSADLIPDRSASGIDLQLGPVAVLNFNRTSLKSIDDVRVRALGEVDTAIELGGYAGIGKTGVFTSPHDRLSVSVSYRHDVADAHSSSILQPTINYFTPLSRRAAVGVFASAERVGRGYARSYYAITPGQTVLSGLPSYTLDDGWKNWRVGALGTVALTGDLLHGVKLIAGGTYGRLLGDFGDSPIVRIAGSRSQWLGAVGLAYTF